MAMWLQTDMINCGGIVLLLGTSNLKTEYSSPSEFSNGGRCCLQIDVYL